MKIHVYKLKTLLFFVFFTVACKYASSQSRPNYTLYMLQQTIVNPAAMTSYNAVNGALLFNAQMVGFPGAPLTGVADVNFPVKKTNLHIGGQVLHESVGVTNKTTMRLKLAYRIKLDMKNYLGIGIGASARLVNANYSEVPVSDPNDPVFSNNVEWGVQPNFSLGFYYFSDNLYVGAGISNFLANRFDYSGGTASGIFNIEVKEMHFYGHAGYQFIVGPRDLWKLQPSVFVRFSPNAPVQGDINFRVLYHDAFGFGVSYRSLSSLVGILSYNYKDIIQIAYGANFGLKYRSNANYTGHEIMLTFKIKSSKKLAPVQVPRF